MDQIIPVAKAEGLAAAVPRSTLAIIETAGHMPMLENPEATTAAIREYLENVEEFEKSKGSKAK
jgi:pimeloyl-ACP methyl ester carboxylesterase